MKTSIHRPLSFAIATVIALGAVTAAAVAQPNTDVYAYPGTQSATGTATVPANVVRAPLPGFATAYAQFGPAATGLGSVRPIVVAAPFVGRGQVQSAGRALRWTGLVAGN